MIRKTLLMTTAAIAAVAIANTADAQGQQRGGGAPSTSPAATPGSPAGGAAAPSGSPGSSSVPAEKASPPIESRGGAAAESDKPASGNAQRRDEAPKAAPGGTAQGGDRGGNKPGAKDSASTPSSPNQRTGAGPADRGNAAAERDNKGGDRNATTDRNSQTTGQGASGSRTNVTVNLNTEQRTRVRETVIRESNAPRAANVTFSINVGTVVPRSQRVAPLPARVVEIEPSWQGYEYFLVGDDIIIVESGTLRIVAVIPA